MKYSSKPDNESIGRNYVLQPAINIVNVGRVGNKIIIDQAVQEKMEHAIGHPENTFPIGIKGRFTVVVVYKGFIINYGEDDKNKIELLELND